MKSKDMTAFKAGNGSIWKKGRKALRLNAAGEKSTGRPKKLPSKVEEDLLAEVQRLRAENAYLKNLQALVLEEERRQRKKRR